MGPDISLNIVIRNLSETKEENITEKVNGLIKEGIKVKNIKVASAIRKRSLRDNTPGVVLASLNNKEDKDEIMRAKSCLKRSRLYKKVFVDHDKCREQ